MNGWCECPLRCGAGVADDEEIITCAECKLKLCRFCFYAGKDHHPCKPPEKDLFEEWPVLEDEPVKPEREPEPAYARARQMG